MTSRIVSILLLCALAMTVGASAGFAERDVVDRIIAIVGNEVILASELANQLQLVALQTGKQPQSEEELQKFQEEILESMISDRLFLIEARKDTTISVRTEEIDQALDDHVARISANFGSEEAFLQALAAEGLTLRDLKRQYRDDVENQLLKQRLIQQKLYTVAVSRHEVEDFYAQFKDSLPAQPEAVKLAHILLQVSASNEVEDSVSSLAADLRQRVLDGADFATLSTNYSSMGAGANGGDLGYMKRDDVVPEFARAAFALNVGDISGVVRTEFGYHVIKCEGKRDDALKLRHILLAVVPSAEDSARAFGLADSLLTELRNGADFAEMAKVYSRDDDTRAQGGELGWFAVNQMPQDFSEAVKDWKTPGEYRGPVPTQFGLHILKLLDYQQEKDYTLEDDYDRIKEMARQNKTDEFIDEWIDSIRAETYIEYRLDT
jgi:peptidyl-prolyl cis-trans isomerase SurA